MKYIYLHTHVNSKRSNLGKFDFLIASLSIKCGIETIEAESY
jgi:hypothetical protein